MNYLKHEVHEIAPKTWCLSEFRLVNAFLVEGEERAALIDTGTGVGNLYGVVRELTEKPLVILITHGHFDHLYCSTFLQKSNPQPSQISFQGGRSWLAYPTNPCYSS